MLQNRYRIIRELAEGGFGKTFLAEDTHMPSGRKCVIKQLKPAHSSPQIYQLIQEKFRLEAAILEELSEHNHQIPRLYAYFSAEEQFYLIQEWIQGQTLSNKLQQVGILDENSVKEILLNLLPVLEYVHSKGIIHRDIKPDNIILRLLDNQPVLIDFGAVKETMGTVVTASGNTTSSIVVGTPGFMPSEQAAGRPLFASDLYSLGLTAIYLLTGRLPRELETDPHTGEILWRHHALSISPSFATILDKAIHPSARDRYINAPAMLAALQSSSSPVPPTVQSPQSPKVPSSPPDLLVGGGGTFNTAVPVPAELNGWNWGSSMLSPFWFLPNRVWVGIIPWISCFFIGTSSATFWWIFSILYIVMFFLLGGKGNVWAWRSRRWQSVDDFKAHQRAWAKLGIIVYSIFLVILVVYLAKSEDSSTTSNPSPSPTESPSPEPSPTTSPSTDSSANNIAQVKIGSLQPYTYDNLFSIYIPEGWTRQKNTEPNEAIIWWTDVTGNGLIKITVREEDSKQTPEQLSNWLQSSLSRWFGSELDFEKKERNKGEKDGLPYASVDWSFTTSYSKGIRGTILGRSIMWQKGNKIVTYTDRVPEEQFERLKQPLNRVNDSLKVNYAATLPE